MKDNSTYSYDEAVSILQSEDSDVRYFVEEDKNVHICLAWDNKIKWAWGSQSIFKEVECFTEKQKSFMFGARFKKEYSNVI